MGPPNEVTPSLRKTRKTSAVEPRTSPPFKPSASMLAGKGAIHLSWDPDDQSVVAYVSQSFSQGTMRAPDGLPLDTIGRLAISIGLECPGSALFGSAAMSDLSPEYAPKPTSAGCSNLRAYALDFTVT